MEQYPRPLPRAFFVAVFAALLLLLVGGWLYYRSELKRHNAIVTSELKAIADLKTQQIVDWRNERLSDANFLFSTPGLREFITLLDRNPGDQAVHKQLHDRLYAMYNNNKYSMMRVYDHTKTQRLSIPERTIHPTQEFFHAMDSAAHYRKIVVYDFHVPHGDTVHLEILIPYFNISNSVFSGCVVLTINPFRKLYPMLKNFPTNSRSAECVLARAEGDSVVIINELRFIKNSPLQIRESINSKTLPAAMAVRNEFGIREGIDYRGIRVLAAVQGVPETPWGLVVKVDREEIDQPFFERMFMFSMIFLLIFFSATAFIAFWWQRRVSEQRHQLYEIEKAKIASELSYQSLFENMLNGFAYCRMIFDENDKPLDFVYLRVNKAFSSQTGLKDVENKRVTEVIPGIREADPGLFETYGKVALTGVPIRFETYVEALKMWFEISVYSPKHEHFVAVFDVVTERKNAELALLESEDRFRLLFEQAPISYQSLDVNGNIIEVNDTWLTTLGYTEEEIIGRNFGEFVHPDFIPFFQKRFPKFKAEGEIKGVEFRMRKKDGSYILVSYEGKVSHDDSGNFRQTHCVFHDITQQRQAELALRTSEERLRAFFESNLFGTILGDIYGGIFEANEEFCRIIGYSREEILGGNVKWDEITPVEFIPADTKGIVEARERGFCTPYEKQYVRKDGSLIWVLVGYILLGQERERSVAFILDISRVKSAEEQLRKLNMELEQRVEQRTEALTLANKELEAFSYSVSHDLRAPLRAIDGFSRIINEDFGKLLDGEAKRLLEVIQHNALKMGQLIDDLLSFSRVGRSNLQVSFISMTEMARAMFFEYTSSEQRERILFTLNPLPDAFGDPTLLRQVWANLLSNAVKFTSKKPQSQIEVSGKVSNGEIIYTIRDNGAGFDMRYHEKLFGVFQRLHSPSEFEGTGVGLATVQRIIHRHRGRVWAESVEYEGATFYFSLPIEEKQL